MEENNNIIYLNYGDEQIAQNDFLKTAADQVQSYVQSQPWSKKRKELFMKYYTDIMNRKVTGASNDSGQWRVNYEGEQIPFESLSKKDQEMAGEAAYFIQQQMNGLATTAKANREAEEKRKAELPLFNNEYFTTQFNGYIGNNQFGGQNWDIQKWNNQDAANEDGIRGTRNRALKLAEHLRNYGNSLKEGEHNFEGSPFTNLDDFKTRLNTAIAALESEDPNDDADALNRLGLNPDTYLSTGANDIVTYGDKEMTRADAIAAREKATQEAEKLKQQQLLEQQKAKQKAEQEKLKQNPYYGQLITSAFGNKFIGRSAQELKTKYGNSDALTKALNDYYLKDNLTPDELSEIHGALKNLPKESIDPYLLKQLNTINRYKGSAPNRFSKLKSVDGFIWDNKNQQVIRVITPTRQQSLQSDLFAGVQTPQEMQQIRLSRPLSKEDNDIIAADGLSMLGDLVSLGGGYAGIGGSAASLISDLYSDLRRGKNVGDVLKNFGKNLAWGIASIVPGAKLAKVATRAARLYSLFNSYGVLSDPEIHKSWQKLLNKEDFTSQDLENIKWTFHAVTGVGNVARGHFTDKKVQNALNSGNTKVQTKSGKTKELTTKQVEEINKIGNKKGQKAAENKFKEITGEEIKEGSFNYSENGRSWYNPARYSKRIRSITRDQEQPLSATKGINNTEIDRLLKIDSEKPFFAAPWKTKTWKDLITASGSNRGAYQIAFGRSYSPNQESAQQTQVQSTQQTQQTQQQATQQSQTTQSNPKQGKRAYSLSKEESKELKSTLQGKNFSNNAAEDGSGVIKLDGFGEIQFSKNPDGSMYLGIVGKQLSGLGKGDLAKRSAVDVLRKDIMKQIDKNVPKTQQSKIKYELIKQLKEKGYLKQGGTINRQKITEYKNYIKK